MFSVGEKKKKPQEAQPNIYDISRMKCGQFVEHSECFGIMHVL